MIFYFSGTGNSRITAEQIAEITDDRAVSINRLIKEGGTKTFRSEMPLVFVAPTYAWRMPKVVEEWIRDTRFEGSREAYFILTCGGSCGNAGAYAEKLCIGKGLQFSGFAEVLMPENYVAMFATPEEEECLAIIQKAKPYIGEIGEKIKNGERFYKTGVSFGDRIRSGPINRLYYPLLVKDRGFTVSDTCITCGKCMERCPLNNITMENGRLKWHGSCTHCMACIAGCPAEAIEYKSGSAGRHRHFIKE